MVDQQVQSPLFSRFTLEIRLAIFQLAMGPHCNNAVTHDFRLRHDHADPHVDGALSESVESAQFTDGGSGDDTEDDDLDSESGGRSGASGRESVTDGEEGNTPFLSWELDDDESDDGSFEADPTYPFHLDPPQYEWLRPDTIGVETLSTTLLRTCRRIYLEATDNRIIPDFVFRTWFGSNPVSDTRPLDGWASADKFYLGLTAPQRNSVVTARTFINGGGLAISTTLKPTHMYGGYVFR
ncbi:hypothetical protein IMZ48_23730, partial [Candidatus Bathyarchaeota archaeon]|nr:hypothetical protein [Candidatus Bathyarchaeota archaeon]